MRKYAFILLFASFLLNAGNCYAQRRNSLGLKMVKSMNMRWYESDGKPIVEISFKLDFQYDSNGNLVRMTRTRKEGKDTYMETYVKDGRKMVCTVLKNGRTIPKYELLLFFDVKQKYVEYRRETYPVYEADGSLEHMSILYTSYQNYEPYTKNYWIDNRQIGPDIQDWADSHVGDDGSKCGFKKWLNVYLTSDNRIVEPVEIMDVKLHLTSWKGDIYEQRLTTDKSLEYMLKYRDYGSKSNDTNVNLFCISNGLALNSPLTNAESFTEWSRYRSKHLMLHDKLSREDGYGNKTYDMTWEYDHDSNGNITEVKVTDRSSFGRYCIAKLEYVY